VSYIRIAQKVPRNFLGETKFGTDIKDFDSFNFFIPAAKQT